jgi:hypothetical protein
MYNNLTGLAYNKIKKIYFNSSSLFVVSIGTRRNDKADFNRPKVLVSRLCLLLKRVLNLSDKLIYDSELVHSEIKNLSLRGKLQYYRFNTGSVKDLKLNK